MGMICICFPSELVVNFTFCVVTVIVIMICIRLALCSLLGLISGVQSSLSRLSHSLNEAWVSFLFYFFILWLNRWGNCWRSSVSAEVYLRSTCSNSFLINFFAELLNRSDHSLLRYSLGWYCIFYCWKVSTSVFLSYDLHYSIKLHQFVVPFYDDFDFIS